MNHRKLITDTINVNISALCERACDPEDYSPRYCLEICTNYCPSFCISPYIPQPPATASHRSLNHHLSLIISLCFVGFAFLLLCLFILHKHYRGNGRHLQEQQQTRDHDQFLDEEVGPVLDHPIWYIRTVGLQPSVIDLITVCKYKRGEGLVEGTDCAVCLSEFEDDETLRLLPKCNHAFHLPCIDTWLRSHTNCPMCRAPIVSNPGGTLLPISGQTSEDSVMGEETRETISEESEGLAQDRDDGDFGSKGVETSRRGRQISESMEKYMVQPIRRSISMDLLAASRLGTAMANGELGEMSKPNTAIIPKRVNLLQRSMESAGASSFRKSLQKGPVSMKRSFSCGGKVLQSRHS